MHLTHNRLGALLPTLERALRQKGEKIVRLLKPTRMRQGLFICGCGHSGTTLLANMLAAHPEVFIPLRETRTFLNPTTAAEMYDRLQGEFAASKMKYLAEKTPRHVHFLDCIRRVAPGAKFLLMVRDGRDVAASSVKRNGSAMRGAQRWVEANEIVLRERGALDVMVLRYEDLIVNTRGKLNEVCTFSGIPFDERMLDYHKNGNLWFGEKAIRKGTGANGIEHTALRNWQVNQPIFDGRGKWREVLGSDDLAFFEAGLARRLLEEFNY